MEEVPRPAFVEAEQVLNIRGDKQHMSHVEFLSSVGGHDNSL